MILRRVGVTNKKKFAPFDHLSICDAHGILYTTHQTVISRVAFVGSLIDDLNLSIKQPTRVKREMSKPPPCMLPLTLW